MPSLPISIISGTYAERVAYSTASLAQGQYWYQTDTVLDGATTYLQGYWYWDSVQWQYTYQGFTDNVFIGRPFPTLVLKNIAPYITRQWKAIVVPDATGGGVGGLFIASDLDEGGDFEGYLIIDESRPDIIVQRSGNLASARMKFIVRNTDESGNREAAVHLQTYDGVSAVDLFTIIARSTTNPTTDPRLTIRDAVAGADRIVIDENGDITLSALASLLVRQASTFFAQYLSVENTFGVGAQHLFRYGRGTDYDVPGLVSNGDVIGKFLWQGHDGVDFQSLAQIEAAVQSTPGVNDMPGRISLGVTPDGSTTIATGLTLTNKRNLIVGAGVTDPTGGGTPVIVVEQASANPTGMPSNSAGIFAKDVAGTCELFTIDEAGNVTQQTPHANIDQAEAAGIVIDADDPYPRIQHEENCYLGIEAFTYISPASGKYQRRTRPLPADQVRDWDADQQLLKAQREWEIVSWQVRKDKHAAAVARWDAMSEEEKEKLKRKRPGPFEDREPLPLEVKPEPGWIKARRVKGDVKKPRSR